MDPITFMILAAVVTAVVTDNASDGWIVGGAKGAARNLWETETARARKARTARRKVNEDSRWGRFKNAVGEETLVILTSIWQGWRAGIRAEQERRRQRREAKQQLRREAAEAPNDESDSTQTPSPNEEAEPKPEVPNEQVTPTSGGLNVPSAATPAVPNEDGSNPERKVPNLVTDMNTAPEVIAAWQSLYSRLEPVVDDAVAIAKESVAAADGMGNFEVGGEGDAAGMVRSFAVSGQKALEEVGAVLAALRKEYADSIEAADGKKASAHAPMQAA